jgi:hypothetical protein
MRASASGHGPVFGLATPTNPRGGWSLDFNLMGRAGARDANSPGACEDASTVGRVVLWIPAGLYVVGLFSAFVLGRLLMAPGD